MKTVTMSEADYAAFKTFQKENGADEKARAKEKAADKLRVPIRKFINAVNRVDDAIEKECGWYVDESDIYTVANIRSEADGLIKRAIRLHALADTMRVNAAQMLKVAESLNKTK